MIEAAITTSTHLPNVVRSWTAAASSDPDRVVLVSTDPADIIVAVSYGAAGIVTDDVMVDSALRGIELGIKTRSRIDPKSLGLTQSEAEIITFSAIGMDWIAVAENVGYCARQVRRISSRLEARFGCTPQALAGLAQVIHLVPTRST